MGDWKFARTSRGLNRAYSPQPLRSLCFVLNVTMARVQPPPCWILCKGPILTRPPAMARMNTAPRPPRRSGCLCDAPDADVHFFRRRNAGESDRHCGGAASRGRACCAPTPGTSMCMRPAPSRPPATNAWRCPAKTGKITARQIRKAVEEHRANASHEHEVQPGMVYISNPTEVGTLYT